jgi:hypothetical protein
MFNRLSNNALKIIACIFMVVDHVGMLLFPQHEVFRILGRIVFPIFAFLIAEGCKYTKNKMMHFATIFSLGVIVQIVFSIITGDFFMSVLLTYSLSILVIYAMQFMKKTLFDKTSRVDYKIISVLLFLTTLFVSFFLTNFKMFTGYGAFCFDYGFGGVMLPVIISLFDFSFMENKNSFIAFMDGKWGRLILTSLGCVLLILLNDLTIYEMNLMWFSYLALPFLLFYNGKRGKWNLKYMFYIFYPLHLVLLEAIAMIVSGNIVF